MVACFDPRPRVRGDLRLAEVSGDPEGFDPRPRVRGDRLMFKSYDQGRVSIRAPA